MEQAAPGFVRITHRRCEDCDIREDLHASGMAIPKRRHRIAGCKTCGGRGELPTTQLKERIDPYADTKARGWKEEQFQKRRRLRASAEVGRFRTSRHFAECELLMQIPPGGFNHGRSRAEDGSWTALESEGMDGDVRWNPSFKNFVEPLPHGTRSRYNRGCKCFACRRAHAEYMRRRYDIARGRGQVISLAATQAGRPSNLSLKPEQAA